MKKTLPLRMPFYIGASLLFIGILFRIQHWPFAYHLLFMAIGVEVIFFVLVLIEIIRSKKASLLAKICWASAYLALVVGIYTISVWMNVIFIAVFLAGRIYLRFGRKYFMYERHDYDHINFDSI